MANYNKGVVTNPNGRPKGSQNKDTHAFKVAIQNLMNRCAPDIIAWVYEIAAEDKSKALDHLARLAEFCYPKLARSEVTGNDGGPVSITIATGVPTPTVITPLQTTPALPKPKDD